MDDILFVGTKGNEKNDGIVCCHVNNEIYQISKIEFADKIENFSFLACAYKKKTLYAAGRDSETNTDFINVYKVNDGDIAFVEKRIVASIGISFMRVAFEDRNLLVSGYDAGNVYCFEIEEEGELSNTYLRFDFPNEKKKQEKEPEVNIYSAEYRQNGSHPHAIYGVDFTGTILIPDLGKDKIWILKKGEHELNLINSCSIKPQSGPRHLVINNETSYVYLLTELTSSLYTLKYEVLEAEMTVVDKKSALPDAYIGNNLSADIVLSPNGKYLYVSNRGANCVCVFEINEENGIPVLLQSVPTAGWPRALQFSENFKVLYILNEEYESSKGSLESYCVSQYGRLSDRTKLLDLENAYNFIRW